MSQDFPSFKIQQEKAVPKFLEWVSRAEWFVTLCKRASEGSTNRVRLKESRFLAERIPLPPLEEQRRIAARLDALKARIDEARASIRQVRKSGNDLLIAMAHREDLNATIKHDAGWIRVRLGDVLTEAAEPHAVDPEARYSNLGIYSFARGVFSKPPISGAETSATTLYRVHPGQFIYSRLFAFEGAYAVVPEDMDGYFASNEFPAFNLDGSRITPAFLTAYFKSPAVWERLAAGSLGLGSRRQRVQVPKLLHHQLMLPPLEWQHKIAATKRRLEGAPSGKAELLDRLLPALLDQVFR